MFGPHSLSRAIAAGHRCFHQADPDTTAKLEGLPRAERRAHARRRYQNTSRYTPEQQEDGQAVARGGYEAVTNQAFASSPERMSTRK